jgi:hypothetical protein
MVWLRAQPFPDHRHERIPIDAVVASNCGVGAFDLPRGQFIGWAINDRVGIEVSGAPRPVGKRRPAVRPQRDQIVAEDPLQFVA